MHSVLDTAPPIALALLVASAWPLAGWNVALRDPPLPWWSWAMVLLPAIALCGWPALAEFRAAWRARSQRLA